MEIIIDAFTHPIPFRPVVGSPKLSFPRPFAEPLREVNCTSEFPQDLAKGGFSSLKTPPISRKIEDGFVARLDKLNPPPGDARVPRTYV